MSGDLGWQRGSCGGGTGWWPTAGALWPAAALLAALLALSAAVPSRAPAQDGVLTLAEASRLALRHYPSVEAARAAGAGAAALVGRARASWWPELSVRSALTRFEERMVVAPFHGLDVASAPQFERTLVQTHVELGYTLWEGGARGARVEAASASSEAASAALAGAEQAVVVRTVGVYLRVLTEAEVLRAHDRRVDALESERDRVARMLAEGKVARVQLMRAEAALSRALADRVDAVSALEVARRELARLTGLEASAVEPGRLARPGRDADPVPGRDALLATALRTSPELERRRRSVAAAEAGVAQARAAYLPRLQLVGRYSQFGSTAGGFTGEWNAGVQLSYPIFTGFARSEGVQRAEAATRGARAELEVAQLRVAAAVDDALSSLTSARARVSALEEAVAQSEEVARIERLALEAGAGVQPDYLAAEAGLLETRAALARARHATIAARAELARVLGELTPSWIEDTLEGG